MFRINFSKNTLKRIPRINPPDSVPDLSGFPGEVPDSFLINRGLPSVKRRCAEIQNFGTPPYFCHISLGGQIFFGDSFELEKAHVRFFMYIC